MTNATGDAALVVSGRTCWQTARADRFATIVDGADYLAHVKAAMLRAKRRIMLIGWDLDYRTAFEPGHPTQLGPNTLGPFLHWLLFREPGVHVYLLKSNLRLLPALDGFWFGVTPVALVNQVTSRRIHFAVDGARPTGAVHHQKIVVVDDDVAFCGGIDLTVGRWDTRDHAPGRNLDRNQVRAHPLGGRRRLHRRPMVRGRIEFHQWFFAGGPQVRPAGELDRPAGCRGRIQGDPAGRHLLRSVPGEVGVVPVEAHRPGTRRLPQEVVLDDPGTGPTGQGSQRMA